MEISSTKGSSHLTLRIASAAPVRTGGRQNRPPRLTAFASSLPSDALINVGHKSSFSQSHQTRPANVTEPQVKVVEKEASRRQALRQAENRWQQQAESQEPQGERCRWLLRLTRAASSPTGEPDLPLANTKVVQEQIQSGAYTQILCHVYITAMHRYTETCV